MKSVRLALFVGAISALLASSLTLFALNITGASKEGANSFVFVGVPIIAREEAITAVASGTITTAYQLTAGVSQVTTIATGGDAVKLPVTTGPNLTAGPGSSILGSQAYIIINGHASNSLNIFPFQAADTINALSGGAAYALAAGKVAECFVGASGKWYCQLSA